MAFVMIDEQCLNTDKIIYVIPTTSDSWSTKIVMEEGKWVKTNQSVQDIHKLVTKAVNDPFFIQWD